jgi:hypothetical protein
MIYEISQALTDKSDWDALKRCIAVPDAVDYRDDVSSAAAQQLLRFHTGGDVAAVCGPAVMDDSDVANKMGACELESERTEW